MVLWAPIFGSFAISVFPASIVCIDHLWHAPDTGILSYPAGVMVISRTWMAFFSGLLLGSSATGAFAQTQSQPMIAPGLWRDVSHVYGPMGAESRITQEQCWEARAGEIQAFIPNIGDHNSTNVETQVRNHGNHSTVQLHSVQILPNGTSTQRIRLVFSDDRSVLHRATMQGAGSLQFSATPQLNEHYRQRGRWLSPTCPPRLAKTQTQILQKPGVPAGLQQLQALSQRLQAQYHPH